MKQKDIALIVVITIISVIVSLLISNAIFSSPANRQQKVSVVQTITTNFPQPDKRFFNNTAFDPTQTIKIGQNNNNNPFSGSNNSTP